MMYDYRLPRMKVQPLPQTLGTIFRRQYWRSIYVAATAEIVPRRVGENRGWRMIRIGTSASWKDDYSNTLQQGAWACDQYIVGRVWCKGIMQSATVLEDVRLWAKETWEPAQRTWWAADPDTDIHQILLHIRAIGENRKFPALFDNEVREILEAEAKAQSEKIVQFRPAVA